MKTDNKRKSLITRLLSSKENSDNPSPTGSLPSWEFIIDSDGNYLNISPEVSDCLGIPGSDFIDQSIFTFSINQDSGNKLNKYFLKKKFPLDVDVIFIANNGNLLFSNLKLTLFSEEYQSKPTYIGIVQALEDLHGSINKISDKQTTEVIAADINSQAFEEEIDEILQGIKNNPPVVEQIAVTQIPDVPRQEPSYSTDILDHLQRYSVEVNHLIEPIDIYKLTYKIIDQMITTPNLSFGIRQKESGNLIFPIQKMENVVRYFPDRDDFDPVLKYIIQNNQAIFQIDQVPPSVKKILSSHLVNIPASLLGVPISTGNHVLGAILLCDRRDDHRFTTLDLQHLTSIGSKMAAALENAFLFQEMQYALSVIETREQYQTLISQSVKILARSGTNNLVEALSLVGKASNVDRVFFAQSNAGEESQTWSLKSTWQIDEKYNPSHLNHEIRFSVFNELIPSLIEKGYFQSNFEQLDRPFDEWLSNRGAKSILVLAVNNEDSIPGIIVLEDLHQNHYWNVDEIRFLGLVSETLSGVLLSEEKIKQLNNKLLETETTNFIKDKLFHADSLNDILHILMKYVFSAEIDECTLYKFDDKTTSAPENFAVLANWTKESEQRTTTQKHNFDQNIVNTVFRQEFPTYFSNIINTNLPVKIIQQLAQMNISSLGIIPLKSKGGKIGSIILSSELVHQFSKEEQNLADLLLDILTKSIEKLFIFEKSKSVMDEFTNSEDIKSQFLANMSHEFRTPLNSIIGFSKVILTGIDGPVNETQKQDLSAIHNAGQYLLRLVNDILDFSKIEAGTMKLNLTRTNIPQLINSILPAVENLVKDKVIKIEVINSEQIPEINVDRDRIVQVLMNMLSNAVKFTDYGKITISTSLVKEPEKNQEIMITISDTGTGINQIEQAKLFKPFEQAKSSENSRAIGSGLGLAISNSLIQLHHGRIGLLNSTPGKGSTFFIALPVDS